METEGQAEEANLKRYPSYRGISERSKALLFLLREIPYINMADIRRLLFPGSHRSYPIEMMGVLLKCGLVRKHRVGDGTFIYYLSGEGGRILDYFIQERPKYCEKFRCFYYQRQPTRPLEVNPFFFFPSPNLEFEFFTPHVIFTSPILHTKRMLELYCKFKSANRFLHVLWVDKVKGRKASLNLPYAPDLLLTNDFTNERRRILVEFENSEVRELRLINKLGHLTSIPADYYLFLASSEDIFQNLGRRIRKILFGEAKIHGQTLFFTSRAHAALVKNVCIGKWIPASENGGVIQTLSETKLFRYDDEVFDKRLFVNETKGGVVQKIDGVVLKKMETIPYTGRKSGVRRWLIREILDQYTEDFKAALSKVVIWNTKSIQENKEGI